MDHSPSSFDQSTQGHHGLIGSALALSLSLISSGLLVWSIHSTPPAAVVSEVHSDADTSSLVVAKSDVVTVAEVVPEVESLVSSQKLHGFWTFDDGIHRRIEVRPDGTATMDIKLDAFSALFYGSEMKLEVTWELEGNVLTYIAVSGKPEDKVARLLRDYGEKQVYKVIAYDGDHLLLELEKDQTRYDWQRESS
ncbi:MAG: hypothetical protein KDA69_08925 [Planctomycetaceae bacterium]|nr:hypothetical protein [Planctomycetaceae bacterium]